MVAFKCLMKIWHLHGILQKQRGKEDYSRGQQISKKIPQEILKKMCKG